MIRLPSPTAVYDPRDQAELRRSLESVLRAISETGQAGDPRRALNNFRVKAESDTEITFAWTRGALVADVWVNHFLVPAPVTGDPWSDASLFDPLDPTEQLGAVDEITLLKPRAGEQRWAQFAPRLSTLSSGPIIRRTIDPAANTVTGAIKALVIDDVADLSVSVSGAKADFPVVAEVLEDSPDAATSLVTHTFAANGTITKVQKPALGARPLPQREMRRWWLRMTNQAGVITYAGPTGADRDPLPDVAVTDSGNQLRIDYDDDCDLVQVVVPGGRTWTRATVGGGSVTYTVGDVLDNSTTESALGLEETRAGYVVRAQGGGQWLVGWAGSLYGPKAPYLGVELTATVTNASAAVAAKVSGPARAFPCAVEIREGSTTGTAVASGTVSVSGGSVSVAGRPLPDWQIQRWWAKATDATGAVRWFGPCAADRDPLPGATVTSDQGAAGGAAAKLLIVFDDDTDVVTVRTPNGGVCSYSTVYGGGGFTSPITYTIGDAPTSGGAEPALANDEVRAGFRVECTGGGTTIEVWRGAMYGPNRTFAPPVWSVSVSPGPSSYSFAWTITSWGSASTGQVDLVVNGTLNAAWPFSGTTISRGSSDQTLQIIARNADGQTDARTFTIPAAAAAPPAPITVYNLSALGTYSTQEVTLSWQPGSIAIGAGTFSVLTRDKLSPSWTIQAYALSTGAVSFPCPLAFNSAGAFTGVGVQWLDVQVIAYNGSGQVVSSQMIHMLGSIPL